MPGQLSRNPGRMDINFNPERDKDNAKYYADQAKQVATQNGFCRMEIREDGHLYLSRTENIVQSLDFKINDKGRLGVMMS